MPIAITCPSCGAKANAPDSAAGKKVKCPKCQGVVAVPKPQRNELDELDEEPVAPPKPAAKGGALVPKKGKPPLDEEEEGFEDEPPPEDEEDFDEEEAPSKKGKGGKAPGAPPNKTTLGIVAILFGALGIHKFMLGRSKEGVITLICSLLCLFPIMAQIGMIEGIIYLAKSEEDFHQTYVVNKRGWL
jgi:TM2 domain-containing membrane protein YozV